LAFRNVRFGSDADIASPTLMSALGQERTLRLTRSPRHGHEEPETKSAHPGLPKSDMILGVPGRAGPMRCSATLILEFLTMAAGASFETTLHQMAQAIVTVLAVINPVVCGSIFLNLTPTLESQKKRRAAVRAALAILIILVASAFIGLHVLGVFGVSLDVFQIVGGIIIAYMGFDMLGGGQKIAQAPPSSAAGADVQNSLTPLIMFAAGPGTITAVVTLAAVHTPDGLPLSALVASTVGAGATLGVLLLVSQLGSRISHNTQAIVTRFMGLIVAAMGMQFVLTGYKAFMHS
jgi:multiple antibiotic resistance protein